MIHDVLARVAAGQDLSQEEMAQVVDSIMQAQWQDPQIEEFLLGLRRKGETVAEVAGAAAAMRRHMTPIRSRREGLVDTCGTGGDGSGTFNISTAAALVTAAAGVPVAKHGNRKVSSQSGSADVLAELGVNVEADVPTVERCLDQLGIAFCFAPLLHPAMKQVVAVRRKLGVPTIFNLLGPLSNPASAPYQVLGVGRLELRPLLAEALARLGARHALVVCGDDGLDEISLAAPTQVSEVQSGTVRHFQWVPEDFGLQTAPIESLRADSPAESASLIRGVLSGQPGPAREIVLLNAAAAVWVAAAVKSPGEAIERVRAAVDSGAAAELLEQLGKASHAA